MKTMKLLTYSALLLLCSIVSLSAQMMETDPKTFSDFYHVPDQVTHRLSEVIGFNGYEDFEYVYNAHNDLERFNSYQTDPGSNERKLVSYNQYLYNDKQQCIEIATYSHRVGWDEMVVSLRECFEYNDKGQLTNYVRWNNHNTAPEDITLVEDQKIAIEYTESGLPIKAQVLLLDPNDFQFYDSFHITLEYNDRGQLYRRTASLGGSQPEEQEEITFDSYGKYMAILTFIDGHQQVIEWQYSRDENGNISNLGRSGFIFEFGFVSGQAAAKSWYPRFNLAKLMLYGFRNFSYLSIPQLYNGSKEAVAKAISSEGTFVYEENKPAAINPLPAPSQSQLQSDATAWTLTDVTSVVALYDLQGQCLQLVDPTEGVAVINKDVVPAGNYIIKSGSQTFKVIR